MDRQYIRDRLQTTINDVMHQQTTLQASLQQNATKCQMEISRVKQRYAHDAETTERQIRDNETELRKLRAELKQLDDRLIAEQNHNNTSAAASDKERRLGRIR